MDGFEEKKWFVYLTDHHEGPFSLAEIQAKMAESQITTANYVWAEGLTDWRPMTEVSEFQSILATTPAPPIMPLESAPAAEEPLVAAPMELVSTSPVVEEKTGDLDPADLQRAKSVMTMPMDSGDESASSAKSSEKSVSTKKVKSGNGRAIKWAIAALIPTGIAGAYLNGNLDPVLNSPGFKASLQTASDLAQPYLLVLADKVPALSKWISPIPSLEDVAPEDYEILKAAATQKPADGIKIAIAPSNGDLFAPVFYVSSNLPDGALIDVYVEGIPDTLLNQLSFHGKVQTTINKKIGRTAPARFADGKPLPRGEYILYATENPQQPDPVKALLARIPPVTAKTASVLPKELKLLVSKPVFLGGIKDATYSSRLKDFHDKLRAKALAEVSEVKQLEATLESQLGQTNGKYNQLKGLVRGGKPSFAAKKSWTDFNTNWLKLEEGLRQSYAKWTDSVLETEYFYGVLYSMTKSAGDAVDKLHQLQDDFFNSRIDAKSFEIQRGSAISIAESAVSALKNKVSQTESLAPTANGMPRREGL